MTSLPVLTGGGGHRKRLIKAGAGGSRFGAMFSGSSCTGFSGGYWFQWRRLVPGGGCAQGAATCQLVSTGQPVAVSQGLEPPSAAR